MAKIRGIYQRSLRSLTGDSRGGRGAWLFPNLPLDGPGKSCYTMPMVNAAALGPSFKRGAFPIGTETIFQNRKDCDVIMSAPLRPEHPRPDRVREHWMTLNGQWDFAFDPQNQGLRKAWYRPENPWMESASPSKCLLSTKAPFLALTARSTAMWCGTNAASGCRSI